MESHANNQYETGYYYCQNKKTAEKAIIIASIFFDQRHLYYKNKIST